MPAPSNQQLWSDDNLANPHGVSDKAARVRWMFESIAPSYDLNNRVHSLWRDQAWRKAAVKAANVQQGDVVVDVACGTGDLTQAFAQHSPASQVVGIDFTPGMLRLAGAKRDSHATTAKVTYQAGDAMRLPLADATADVVSIAFGIRNVSDPAAALAEFHRVLKPGGRLVILEFGLPRNPLLLGLYNFYFRQILPRTAALIARDRTGAYAYLPRSVETFIDRDAMVKLLGESAFDQTTVKGLTFGICMLYRAARPSV